MPSAAANTKLIVGTRLLGTGSAVPERVMTNHDFEKIVDTSDEWITSRTGIKQRYISGPHETTASLGLEAAKKALLAAEIAADQLDLIIVATISPEMIFPATACFVQQGLGVGSIPAFDISAACSGFVYALEVGNQFIRSGQYRTVMVIGAETLSKFTDFTDRTTCVLFADGAGAAVLQACDDPQRGSLYHHIGADGDAWNLLMCPGGGSRYPASEQTVADRKHYMAIRGREVFKIAVNRITELVTEMLEKTELSVSDVTMVIPHQMNQRIIDATVRKLGFSHDKVYVNIDRYGNTSAASIGIALDEALRKGAVHPGQIVIFVAIGAGITWGASVWRL